MVRRGRVSSYVNANEKFKGSFGVLSSTQHVSLHGAIKIARRPYILGRFLNRLDW